MLGRLSFLPSTQIFSTMKHYHIISRISIYMLSVVLILFGIFHFTYPRDLMAYVPSSLYGGIAWAYIVGAAYILAGLSFMTNQYVKFTGYLFAAMLIFFILTIHLPNYLNAGDREMQQLALISMLKDFAIAGFSLHLAAGAFHQHFHLEDSD
jgi:uncharacterized membrane protein